MSPVASTSFIERTLAEMRLQRAGQGRVPASDGEEDDAPFTEVVGYGESGFFAWELFFWDGAGRQSSPRPPQSSQHCDRRDPHQLTLLRSRHTKPSHHTPYASIRNACMLQSLCRCATKKRGEPLAVYVRRISSAAAEAEVEELQGQARMEVPAATAVPPLLLLPPGAPTTGQDGDNGGRP